MVSGSNQPPRNQQAFTYFRQLMESVMADYGVDTVIHFAGSVVVPESIENPLKYYENNTGNSRNLIEAAVRSGCKKLIFSSTAAVYGEPSTTGPISENAILNPMSPYGTSKLMTELMICWVLCGHLGTLWVRSSLHPVIDF